ncbi:hypothetical protein VPH35_136497 [Triticum aestivum]
MGYHSDSLDICFGTQLTDSRGHIGGETRWVGVGVHPLTRYAVSCIESLAPHRPALDLILASTSDSFEGVNSFGDLFSELIASLEPNLEEKSALRGAEGGGLRHLFLANNTSFVLKRVGAIGGDDEWAACRQSRVEQHVAGYAEASWALVVACLEAGKPATKVLAKFNAALEKAYSSHVHYEVSDPELRAALWKAVSEKVVGAYGAYLLEHPKLVKSGRYTLDSLASLVSDLFKGEDAMPRSRDLNDESSDNQLGGADLGRRDVQPQAAAGAGEPRRPRWQKIATCAQAAEAPLSCSGLFLQSCYYRKLPRFPLGSKLPWYSYASYQVYVAQVTVLFT